MAVDTLGDKELWQRIGLPNVFFTSFYRSPKLFSPLRYNYYCVPQDTIEADTIPQFPVFGIHLHAANLS